MYQFRVSTAPSIRASVGNECALTAQGQVFNNNIPEFKYDTLSTVLAPY